jgi:uncharacterized integral membrane protein
MSTAAQTPKPPDTEPAAPDRRKRLDQARTLGLLVLAVLITLFAVLNVKQVTVNWIVGSGKAPLIIVIVVSLLVGIVLTHFVERRVGRRR